MHSDVVQPNKDPKELDPNDFDNNLTVRTLRSLQGWASSSKNLASQIIVEVPRSSFQRIGKKEGVGSVYRETKHFTGTTTMHGPKRIFYGKGGARAFWIVMVSLALAMLIFQIYVLLKMYFSKPTLSQVSFIANEGGMEFPSVTVCNFNPIKRSYVRELNTTGSLSGRTLEYLLQTNMDIMFLFSNLDRKTIRQTHEEAQIYFDKNPDFRIVKFLKTAGYECSEMFVSCYFGGRRFDCCKYMKPRITSLGKCYQLDLQNLAPDWMRKQISPGAEAGLQIVADARLDEELNGQDGEADAIFADVYENGFRYYIHSPDLNPELSSEGISVSPSRTVYSAIKSASHNLLRRDSWGNCTDEWPDGYDTYLPYSATACRSLCLARYFLEKCACSPFTYNIDGKKPICTPYEAITCMDNHMLKKFNDTEYLEYPDCLECHIECESTTFSAFNSYGDGFNPGSLRWLERIDNRTEHDVRKNIAIMNIFYLEMFYTYYTQIQATSLTEILSDIGGNMGMFLGMSVITITELSLFFSKIFWIMVSKRRREYLFAKKKREKEKEKHIEEAVKEIQEMRSRRNSRDNLSTNKVAPMEDHRPKMFGYQNSEENGSSSSVESLVTFKFDVDELKKKLSQPSDNGITRLRLPSVAEKPKSSTCSPPPSVPVFTIEPPTPKHSTAAN